MADGPGRWLAQRPAVMCYTNLGAAGAPSLSNHLIGQLLGPPSSGWTARWQGRLISTSLRVELKSSIDQILCGFFWLTSKTTSFLTVLFSTTHYLHTRKSRQQPGGALLSESFTVSHVRRKTQPFYGLSEVQSQQGGPGNYISLSKFD